MANIQDLIDEYKALPRKEGQETTQERRVILGLEIIMRGMKEIYSVQADHTAELTAIHNKVKDLWDGIKP